MKRQFEKNEERCNLRPREVSLSEGQEVYRRNFNQGNFAAGLMRSWVHRSYKRKWRRRLGKFIMISRIYRGVMLAGSMQRILFVPNRSRHRGSGSHRGTRG